MAGTPWWDAIATANWQGAWGGAPSERAPAQELLALVGLEAVKEEALHTFQRVHAAAALPAQSRFPVALNYAFLGNPRQGGPPLRWHSPASFHVY